MVLTKNTKVRGGAVVSFKIFTFFFTSRNVFQDGLTKTMQKRKVFVFYFGGIVRCPTSKLVFYLDPFFFFFSSGWSTKTLAKFPIVGCVLFLGFLAE